MDGGGIWRQIASYYIILYFLYLKISILNLAIYSILYSNFFILYRTKKDIL